MILKEAWCKETAHPSYREKWTKENPASGQCLPTCLMMQEIYGGDICATKVGRYSHFILLVNGHIYDPTKSQFGNIDIQYQKPFKVRNREQLLKNKDVKQRYELLKERYYTQVE